jgi:hypothetical protein
MMKEKEKYDPGKRMNRIIEILFLISLLFAVAGLLKMWLGE